MQHSKTSNEGSRLSTAVNFYQAFQHDRCSTGGLAGCDTQVRSCSEGLDLQVMAKLNKLPGVKAIPRDERLKEKHAHSRIWNETWLSAFFHKPCNHELFVLQSLNMEGAISLAPP